MRPSLAGNGAAPNTTTATCALAVLPLESSKSTALTALLKLLEMAPRRRDSASFDTKRTRLPEAHVREPRSRGCEQFAPPMRVQSEIRTRADRESRHRLFGQLPALRRIVRTCYSPRARQVVLSRVQYFTFTDSSKVRVGVGPAR